MILSQFIKNLSWRAKRPWLFLICALFTAGCKQTNDFTATTGQADISGYWVGAIPLNGNKSLMRATLLLRQSGNTAHGTYKWGKMIGTAGATITGNSFKIKYRLMISSNCAGSYEGEGQIESSVMKIHYSGSDCAGTRSNGEVTLIKQ